MTEEKIQRQFPKAIFGVFLLGLAIRLFAYRYTYIINPDGVLYIHQARAIYYGQWEKIISCALSYLPNYSIFIAGVYVFLNHWVTAAKTVSLLFGSAALVPLYFLSKCFFEEKISVLATLLFAVIPVLVGRSVDVVREPVCWFFLVLGLYLFVSRIHQNKYRLFLFLSCVSYLMAAWARIEAVLFIVVSCFYIVVVNQERRLEKLAIFVAPFLLVVVLSFSVVEISGQPVNYLHRADEVGTKLRLAISQYQKLRTELTVLAGQYQDGFLEFFVPEARKNVWLIAFGTLLNRVLEAFFYPLFLIFAIGLGGAWGRIKEDRRVLYFALLAASGLILLYVHTLHTWMLYYRNMAIVIFPCLVFAGFGLERIVRYLQSRFGLKESLAVTIVCLLILVSALPKNLKPRASDQRIFREIGQVIASREGNTQEIAVATSSHVIRWISFYANLDFQGAPCPERYSGLAENVGDNYDQFVQKLKQREIRYFLWVEHQWPNNTFDFIATRNVEDFTEVGYWHHPGTGKLILFEVT